MKLNTLSLASLAAAGLLSLTTSVRAEDATPATPAKPATPTAPAIPPPLRRGNARMAVDVQLKNLTERLKLTEEQQPKVKAVLEEQFKDRQALRTVAPEERAAKMKEMREEHTKKMKEVLTAEQFKQFEASQKLRPGVRPNNSATPPPAK